MNTVAVLMLLRGGRHRREEASVYIGVGTVVLVLLVVILFMAFRGRRT